MNRFSTQQNGMTNSFFLNLVFIAFWKRALHIYYIYIYIYVYIYIYIYIYIFGWNDSSSNSNTKTHRGKWCASKNRFVRLLGMHWIFGHRKLEVCTGSKLKPEPGPYPRSSDPTRPDPSGIVKFRARTRPEIPPPTTNNKKKKEKGCISRLHAKKRIN